MNLVAALLFLVGLSLSALGGAGRFDARRRRSWPVARGKVVHVEVLAVGPYFVGVVRYAYALQAVTAYRGGESMEGRIESVTMTTRGEAEETLLAYPMGGAIEVRYDPMRPTLSIAGAASGEPRFSSWLGILGLVLTAMAGLVALLG